ncbi:MAG: alginate export family protein, partial [Bacteroidota bacterium]
MEIRPRAELRHGFKDLIASNEKSAFFVEQRSRLNLLFQNEKFSTSIKLQDIRIWGETGQINKSDNLFSVHEAWAQYAFNKKLSVRVGRQELVYDDHRILGNLEWAAQARSHDVLKLIYFDSVWTLHAAVAYNQNSNIPEPAKLTDNFYTAPGGFTQVGGGLPNYKYMQMFWADRTWNRFYTSFLFLNTGWQMPDTTINNMATTGINPAFTISKKLKVQG